MNQLNEIHLEFGLGNGCVDLVRVKDSLPPSSTRPSQITILVNRVYDLKLSFCVRVKNLKMNQNILIKPFYSIFDNHHQTL